MAVSPTRRLFTVDEYHRMADAGIFAADDRVELIGGEIVQMTPIGTRHAAVVRCLVEHLVQTVAGRAHVSPQNPAVLDDLSEPQPDVCLLRRRADVYAEAHPRPDDILLTIEVSDSTLAFDRDVKVPRYGATGVLETWIVDLVRDKILVFSDPGPRGYASAASFGRGDEISPAAFPDVRLTVDDIIPAR